MYTMQTKKNLIQSQVNMADWIEAKGILDKWSKVKNTKELQKLIMLFVKTTLYTQKVEGELLSCEIIYNELRSQKIKAEQDAKDLMDRQVELLDEVNRLKRKIKMYE